MKTKFILQNIALLLIFMNIKSAITDNYQDNDDRNLFSKGNFPIYIDSAFLCNIGRTKYLNTLSKDFILNFMDNDSNELMNEYYWDYGRFFPLYKYELFDFHLYIIYFSGSAGGIDEEIYALTESKNNNTKNCFLVGLIQGDASFYSIRTSTLHDNGDVFSINQHTFFDGNDNIVKISCDSIKYNILRSKATR